MLKEHEKLIAFLALGAAVLAIALLAFFVPIADNTAAQRIIDTALGALTLALGSSVNALFRIRDPSEQRVTVANPPSNPVPVEPAE